MSTPLDNPAPDHAGAPDSNAPDPALTGAAHALDALAHADRAALRPEAAARIALAAAGAARPVLAHSGQAREAGRDAGSHRRRRRVPWHLALATVVALAGAGSVLTLLSQRGGGSTGPTVPGPIAQLSPADEAAALEESLFLAGLFTSASNRELDVLAADAIALSVDIQLGAQAPTVFDEGSAS